jgi:hypothetical protein
LKVAYRLVFAPFIGLFWMVQGLFCWCIFLAAVLVAMSVKIHKDVQRVLGNVRSLNGAGALQQKLFSFTLMSSSEKDGVHHRPFHICAHANKANHKVFHEYSPAFPVWRELRRLQQDVVE